jgi:hypothetical protein
MQMAITGGMVDKTKNPVQVGIKKGSKKCFGCNTTPINRMCFYRNWKDESRSMYAFRVFQKIHLLPTCKKPDFAYEEKEEFKQKYCDELGVSYQELFPRASGRRGGKRGGRKVKVYKVLS